jgi:Transposase DDE domain
MKLRPKPTVFPKAEPLDKLLAEPLFCGVPLAIVPHCQAVPLGVLVRGTLEWLLDKPTLEMLFQQQAPDHYTRELTLAALVGLLIQVSVGAHRSVHAAYKADQATTQPIITASAAALYGKLGRLPPAVSEAVVRYSAQRCTQLLDLLPRLRSEPLPGYRLRVLDGNVLAGSEHRLTPLRRWLNACLPGKSLVVYEPGSGLVTDVVLCADAYTQERALLTQILPRLQAWDLLLADRNFCTTRYVFGVQHRQAFVIVRQHKRNLPCVPLTALKKGGATATGLVYEQQVQVTDPVRGEVLELRRIEMRLFEKTRDGERTLALLSNLPEQVAAQVIAELYLERWTIEKHFQFLTQSLHCELPGLGQPQAALFGFAMAVVAGNALAVVRGSLRSVHGRAAEAEISGYYLADEISHDYRTLMKYLPAAQWIGWRDLAAAALVRLLLAVAKHVNLKALTRSQRGPKLPPKVKPVYDKKHKHYSSYRILKGLQQEDSS